MKTSARFLRYVKKALTERNKRTFSLIILSLVFLSPVGDGKPLKAFSFVHADEGIFLLKSNDYFQFPNV